MEIPQLTLDFGTLDKLPSTSSGQAVQAHSTSSVQASALRAT